MKTRVVCFIKPDLDTVVAGSLLGAEHALVRPLPHEAPEQLLADKRVLCLECGGSGRIAEKNFDHHGEEVLPCAAEQAWHAIGAPQTLRSLVAYTAAVDTGSGRPAQGAEGITLSALLSGMRLCHTSPAAQFSAGLRLVACVCARQSDPEDVAWLPAHDALAPQYLMAKQAAQQKLEALAPQAVTLAHTPCTVMLLAAEVPGVHGLLRRLGAEISLAWNPPRHQWTLAAAHGFASYIRDTLALLKQREPGWGGPAGGGIIGSPRGGSKLLLSDILACLRTAL